jgi:putative transposase
MAPLRGWAPRGKRLKGEAPHGHWKTLTFIGALRADGLTAPCLFDGPINGDAFRAYVEQVLAPTLRPGDIVIMDNLGSHKGRETRRLIRAKGARLWFLPAYSPDLNPIEQAISKIKHAMRTACERTVDAVTDTLAKVIASITPTECENYIANAGYASV